MRLTALVMAITHNAVSSGVHSGESCTSPASGTLNWNQVTPMKYKIVAASTCPATLAGADMSRKSSIRPTTKMAAAPKMSPRGSDDPRNSWSSDGIDAATANVTSSPKNMATPPAWGVTRWWTLRTSGWATYPIWTAIRRAGNVSSQVEATATANRTAYQLSGTPELTGSSLPFHPSAARHAPARSG